MLAKPSPRRVHLRTDFEYIIVKAPRRSPWGNAGYACVITQATAYPDERAIYHICTFHGRDGTKVRAEARRYGSEIKRGLRGVGWRDQYLPSDFPRAGLPKREDQIEVRGPCRT